MRVKDKIFYQIATDRNYKVGDVIHFGDKYNFQGERVINGCKIDNKQLYIQGFKFVDSKKIFANKDLVLELSKQLEEYDFIMRELALENVREKLYPSKPSRLKCMFLVEDRETCVNNLKTFAQSGRGKHFQAIAVKLNGNLFYAKKFLVKRDGSEYNKYQERAKKYWTQKQNLDEKTSEILFEGDAEIVEIIDEYVVKY